MGERKRRAEAKAVWQTLYDQAPQVGGGQSLLTAEFFDPVTMQTDPNFVAEDWLPDVARALRAIITAAGTDKPMLCGACDTSFAEELPVAFMRLLPGLAPKPGDQGILSGLCVRCAADRPAAAERLIRRIDPSARLAPTGTA